MGLVRKTLSAVALALAEVDGDGESGGSGNDVDGGSSSEVETTEDEGPASAVPGPACDGVVDDGGPDEDEDEKRAETTTLRNSTDSEGSPEIRAVIGRNDERQREKHLRDACEHSLVCSEEDGGDARAAD
mgnify:CR=1 FL=1